MRTFNDEISYGDSAQIVPAIPYARTSAKVLGLCRDSDIGARIGHPTDACNVFAPMMLPDRETLAVMCLDERRTVITAFVASVGTANMVTCEPSAIFRPAMLLGASAILIAHNHPNGNPTPSDADIQTTKMIEACSSILGIVFVDHIVLASGGYRSISEYMETHF